MQTCGHCPDKSCQGGSDPKCQLEVSTDLQKSMKAVKSCFDACKDVQCRGFLIGSMSVESGEALRAVGIGSNKEAYHRALCLALHPLPSAPPPLSLPRPPLPFLNLVSSPPPLPSTVPSYALRYAFKMSDHWDNFGKRAFLIAGKASWCQVYPATYADNKDCFPPLRPSRARQVLRG